METGKKDKPKRIAPNRHLGRVITLQSLYEYEMREQIHDKDNDLKKIVARNIASYDGMLGDEDFVWRLVNSTFDKRDELDAILTPLAPEWPIDQLAGIDRNILRTATNELLNMRDDVPVRVAINEAVELAQSFGSENAAKFINGVLGTVYRTHVEPEMIKNNEVSSEEIERNRQRKAPDVIEKDQQQDA
jgi:N utilization substance protein B